MDTHFPRGIASILWPDSATPHNAEEVTDALNNMRPSVEEWRFVTQSYDVQPVEKVHAIATGRVYRGGQQFYSVEQLRQRVRQVLTEMQQQGEGRHLFNELIVKLPGRLQQIIDTDGARLPDKW